MRWWQRILRWLAIRYLVPTEPVWVYLTAPEPRPSGTPIVLVASDRTTVVAEFRMAGRRPWRLMHEGQLYECIERQGEAFVYKRTA